MKRGEEKKRQSLTEFSRSFWQILLLFLPFRFFNFFFFFFFHFPFRFFFCYFFSSSSSPSCQNGLPAASPLAQSPLRPTPSQPASSLLLSLLFPSPDLPSSLCRPRHLFSPSRVLLRRFFFFWDCLPWPPYLSPSPFVTRFVISSRPHSSPAHCDQEVPGPWPREPWRDWRTAAWPGTGTGTGTAAAAAECAAAVQH